MIPSEQNLNFARAIAGTAPWSSSAAACYEGDFAALAADPLCWRRTTSLRRP